MLYKTRHNLMYAENTYIYGDSMADPASIGIVIVALGAIAALFWLFIRMANSFKEGIQKEFDQKLNLHKDFYEEKFKTSNDKLEDNKEYTDLKHEEAIREISHIREIQKGRLRELSEKIDELREQVTVGQQQTMDILSKLLIKDN